MKQLEGYEIANWDISSPSVVAYVGFLTIGGEWYIAQYLIGTGDVSYVRGSEGYAAQWVARAGLTYVSFDAAF